MNQPTFADIGSYPVSGISDIPGLIDYPTLRVEFEGNFSPSNWIPVGRIFRLVSLAGEPPTIAESRVVWLQQPTLIHWSGLDLPYSLKFEPSRWFTNTPLTISLYGSLSQPPSGGGGGVTQEQIQDALGNMLTSSDSIEWIYNDQVNKIALVAIFGTIEGTVCEGNDARLSDQRTPLNDSVTDAKVASNAAIAWSKLSKNGATPGDIGAVGPGHTHPTSAIADFLEAVQDAVNNLIQVGDKMTKSYDDNAGVLLLNADSGGSQVQTWSDLILNSTAWEAVIT